jgi:hypothetical protein
MVTPDINIVTISFTLMMGIITLFLPRRFTGIPILILACYMTLGQRIIIATADFTMLRIILLFCWIRIILRGELSSIKINTIDKILILYIFSAIVTYTLLWNTTAALITSLGLAYDAIGLYFFFRILIRDFDDINLLVKTLAIIIVPLAGLMLVEKATGKNLFYIFGGVPMFSQIREGSVRCQGSFGHPILAGTFGATSLPFFIALWFRDEGSKMLPIIGFIAATIIAVTPASSGPAMAYLFAIIAMLMWRFREHMRAIRWGILIALISLHMAMKAPVWYLIGKLGHLIGGSGWHRSDLIDSFIHHFSEWWLIGTTYTRHWMPTGVLYSPDQTDITNQFIRVGVDGGMVTLILFIAVIVLCFRGVGQALKAAKNEPFAIRIILWAMGAALVAHIASFISVRYFDQIIVFWYLLLAMISTASCLFMEKRL